MPAHAAARMLARKISLNFDICGNFLLRKKSGIIVRPRYLLPVARNNYSSAWLESRCLVSVHCLIRRKILGFGILKDQDEANFTAAQVVRSGRPSSLGVSADSIVRDGFEQSPGMPPPDYAGAASCKRRGA